MPRRPLRRPNMRRAVILFPSGLTLGNLFFGVFAIIAASRGQFVQAGVFVLLGGACDALDGQVARATNAGTQFGEELDSLVDAITFGLAPGLIMYFAVLNRDNWDWLVVFLFAACAVMRLARFNIEQAGTAKTYFQGLPSPAAGITLASYYWFSQSWLYNYGAIADLQWHVLLRYLMAALAFLMISNIPYPVFPRTGFRSLRAVGATLLLVGSIALLATKKLEFFFPFALCYVAWGPIRWIFSGLFERRQPTIPYDLSEGEDDEEEDEDDAFGPIDSQVHASRQSERVARPARSEHIERTERPARERTESSARPPRPERTPRSDVVTPVAKTERADAPDRAARPDRDARPERTEAERAARREKREKREKRDKRRERGARPDVVAESESPETDVSANVAAESPAEALVIPALSVVRTESDGSLPEEPVDRQTLEGANPRKRKRRRRRGQRDRLAGEAAGPDDGSDAPDGDEGDAGDVGDSPDVFERSDAVEPSVPPRASFGQPRETSGDRAERSPYAAPAAQPSPAQSSPAPQSTPAAVPPLPSEPSE
ncbi:MAG: CDP-diacylglycerol--serine O-phosphatidyltransferase [Gemmatimonadaceae bacterium]